MEYYEVIKILITNLIATQKMVMVVNGKSIFKLCAHSNYNDVRRSFP